MASGNPCEPTRLRESRADGDSFRHDRVYCYAERTFVSDAEFFSGRFRADAGGLTTTFLGDGEVRYQVEIVSATMQDQTVGS
jgi:hypothetical protein